MKNETGHIRKRFDWLRLLGLGRVGSEEREAPSCVMIQIDGLSYRNFRRALQTNKLPFLKRLLAAQKAAAGPWHSMLPTSTSAFQTGLFYGNNDGIPGFFWYDRRLRRRVKMNGAEDTARVEEEMRRRVEPYPGLLAGGSSYSALFTGGADNTFLTFARLFSPRLNMSSRRGWIWLFLLSQVLLALRIAYYSAIEFCLGIYDLVRALFTHKNRAAEFKFIIPRIISVVVCREIATLATILDISRGVGPIYLNYFAYDEHAHLRGPNSRFAFWTLRGIDASIRRIWKAAEKARKNGVRSYDVFIWSDHGQTPSTPFQELFEETPERHFDMLFRAIYGSEPLATSLVNGHTKHSSSPAARNLNWWHGRLARDAHHGRDARATKKVRVSPETLEMQARHADQLREMGPPWMHRLINPLIRPAREIEGTMQRAAPPDPQRRVALVSTGPLAHLCLDRADAVPLTYEDWREHYPFFLELIAQHNGIGFTLARTRDGGCRVGIGGRWLDLMDTEAIRRAVPLAIAQILISRQIDLRRLANMPDAGDLVLFGQRDPDRPAISYTYEHGAHGGPSPHETLPFIVVPVGAAADWPEIFKAKTERLITLADLHERLRDAYNPQAEDLPGNPQAQSVVEI